jgi:hypothetical protein
MLDTAPSGFRPFTMNEYRANKACVACAFFPTPKNVLKHEDAVESTVSK